MMPNNNSYQNNDGVRLYDIDASVHKPVNNGYRVKVCMAQLGIYINGMMVFMPNDEHEQWAIYPPATRAGRGAYKYIIEFDKTTTLWAEVQDACIAAVDEYYGLPENTSNSVKPASSSSSSVYVNHEEDDDPDSEPIRLEDIPF